MTQQPLVQRLGAGEAPQRARPVCLTGGPVSEGRTIWVASAQGSHSRGRRTKSIHFIIVLKTGLFASPTNARFAHCVDLRRQKQVGEAISTVRPA